ncbi:hypothetical protein SUGI_0374980 [Cryptomeria japonica]|nr:hypothetical protein SUGI_0374980 [Cryptomeria japonica]
MRLLVLVALLLFALVLEPSMAARPLHQRGEATVLFQLKPRGSVPPSCASGCRNYSSSKGRTGCKCPVGLIHVAGASLAHPKFHGGSLEIAQSTGIDQYS